jgi:hypothetical protein
MSSEADQRVHEAIQSATNAARDLQENVEQMEILNSSYMADYYFDNLQYISISEEFWDNSLDSFKTLEIYGSESSFATAVQQFLDAANSWNAHVYSSIRSRRGEFYRDSDEKVVLKVSLYAIAGREEFTQALDLWAPLVLFCETSSLRSHQSMQYVVVYYQQLAGEVKSTFDHISTTRGFSAADRGLFRRQFDELQYKTNQIQLGFETDGAAWEEQRETENLEILRRRQEEEEERERVRLEEEYRRQRAKKAAEYQRMQDLKLKEEQDKQRLALQKLADERRKNQQLRWSIRNESEKLEELLGQDGRDSRTIAAYARGLLTPFAVYYEEGFTEQHPKEKLPPWPKA